MVLHASLTKTVVGGAAVFAASKALKVVQQGDISIVERFGRFHKTLEPGLHIMIPFVDRVRASVTLREQVLDIPPQKCITSDNAPLAADAVVYWRVVDPAKTVYAVVDLELAIQNLVLTELRAEIGKLTLDMTFSAREQINAVLLEDLDIATDPWGVKITRVEVRDIIPNQEILKAMEMQMAAERTKRADIIKSEGVRERSINVAEGQARSRLIDAEASAKAVLLEGDAEANRLEVEAQGVSKALSAIASSLGGDVEAAARFQLLREYIAAQRDLATSENAKVIVASPGSSGAAEDILAKAMAFYQVSP
jgi:regulator of protease activity HflC (stomatin/prohibitin superfamily)